MDLSINFPLILVLLTGGCGLVWLFEVYWLAPRRPKAEGNPDQSNLAQPAVVEYAISFFPYCCSFWSCVLSSRSHFRFLQGP